MAYIWCDTYGWNEFILSQDDIDIICHSGDNEPAVREVMQRPAIAEQLAKIDIRKMKVSLLETGAWDESELQDIELCKMRLIWLAAWDCYESPEFYIEE